MSGTYLTVTLSEILYEFNSKIFEKIKKNLKKHDNSIR
ncbi:Uncharacterized protein dnm_065570 [Desulfonema magnum]|uniref:Uncharacterized protein n=1 Tax=Desulfonema magnum TaxID=45655 RepID=A0A975BRS8_9BACT|nr:Uncharacterized protein dnm_065570 [Desulfonema magnum]